MHNLFFLPGITKRWNFRSSPGRGNTTGAHQRQSCYFHDRFSIGLMLVVKMGRYVVQTVIRIISMQQFISPCALWKKRYIFCALQKLSSLFTTLYYTKISAPKGCGCYCCKSLVRGTTHVAFRGSYHLKFL